MWSVVLRILSILGIVLLLLLALALVILLLILFWPVSYRGGGSARAGRYQVWFRFRWLCGLLRGAYMYPEGGFRFKLLWMTVYDSGRKPGNGTSRGRKAKQDAMPEEKTRHRENAVRENERTQCQPSPVIGPAEDKTGQSPSGSGDRASDEIGKPSPPNIAGDSGKKEEKSSEREENGQNPPLSEKLSKMKESLRFYLDIVQDTANQELVKHALTRLYKIIKSLRPRFLHAEVLAGLGEPDLTGYAYGGYWAIKPFLGKKCHVTVTPDFERKILEGEFALGGRIMVATLAHHAVRVLLDRRLRRLLDRLKSRN